MFQIILTIIFYIWLLLVLILLWRQATNFHTRMQELQHALIELAEKNATAANKAAEAALILAKKMEHLE